MAESIFPPIHIRTVYENDGSAKSSFLAEVAAMAGNAKRTFETSFGDINRVIQSSLSAFKGGNFGFSVDIPGLRQAAADADLAQQRLSLVRDAAVSLARSTGDTSASTVKFTQALSAQVIEAERAKTAAQGQVTTYERLQGEIDRTIAGNTRLAESYRAAQIAAGKAKFETQASGVVPDNRSGVQRLVAGDASLDRAAASATTLDQVLGRVAKKGAAVSQALREAAQAAANAASGVARADDEAAAAKRRLSDQAQALQSRLDPLFAALQRLDQEQRQANILFREGAISAEVQGQALRVARDNYEQTKRQIEGVRVETERLAAAQAAAAAGRARGVAPSFGVDRLVAGGASLDRAAASAVTLEQILGRVQSKGALVGEALAASSAELANDLQRVQAAIDPTIIAQHRLNAELERADRVFAAAKISEREYGLAVNAAANNYQALVTGARRGTDALRAVTNSTRAVRVASLQAGQQLQDIAISLKGGQEAGLVFAQQLPQLAFALTGLEGSANKTQDRIGKFATFLSGPWGLAVGLAVGAIVTLVGSLISAGDESDRTKAKTLDLGEALKRSRFATDEGRKAIDEYNDAQGRQRDGAERAIKINLRQAESDLAAAVATRERTAATLESIRSQVLQGPGIGSDPLAGIGLAVGGGRLEGELAKNQADIDRLREATRNLRINDAVRDAKAAIDPIQAINNRYDDMAEAAKKAAAGNDKLSRSLKGALTSIETRRAADLEARREADRGPARDAAGTARTPRDPGELSSFISPVSGGRITGQFGEQRPGHRHGGVDIAVPVGTQVRAPAGGTVIEAGTLPGYGNVVFIDHGAGTVTRLAHLSQIGVAKGQELAQGQVIGLSGGARGAEGAGNSRGPHLHEEVRLNGRAVNPLTGRFPTDEIDVASDALADAQREAEKLQQVGDNAAAAIANINRQFDEQPRFVDQSAKAVQDLNSLIKDLEQSNVEGVFDAAIAQAKAARDLAASAPGREVASAIRQINEDSERRLQIQTLQLSGRDAEATALQQIWQIEERLVPLTDAQKQNVLAIAEAEERRGEAIQRAKEIQDAYLEATRSIRGEVEAILSGQGKLSNFKNIFRQLQGRVLTEKLFGPIFRDLEKNIRANTGIDGAVDKMATQTTRAGDAASNFADAVNGAANRIATGAGGGAPAGLLSNFDAAFGGGRAAAGIGTGIASALAFLGSATGRGAANDNGGGGYTGGEIVVVGRPDGRTLGSLTPASYGDLVANALTRPLLKSLDSIVPGLSGVIGGALGGYATGGIPGGIIGALKGIKGLPGAVDKLFGASNVLGKAAEGAATGTAIAGIGKALGIKTSTTGAQAGGAIGGAIGIPGGGIVGSILGGLVGGLFKKTKSGSASISVGSDGFQVGTLSGNSGSRKEAASGLAGNVSDSLNRIAQQLGGTASGPIGVSIGVRDKSFRVDPTGGGATKKKKGAIDFGDDQEAAIKFAIADAISDGAIQGLRAGTQKILQAGKDIEAQLDKALAFESIFTRLRTLEDPVGAAVDAVDKEFARLRKIATEAGEGLVEVERLYGLERAAAIKQAGEQLTGSLKSLLADLTINNDALSLRDRKAAAQAAFDPLKARLAGGDLTASDDFAAASRTLLDLERQISGSQGGYFDLLGQIKGLAGVTLDKQNAIVSAANDSGAVVNAVQNQTADMNAKLDAVNDNLGTLILQNGTGSSFTSFDFATFY